MLEYSNTDMRNVINEYVHSHRYRHLLILRFCEGMTYDEIAGHTRFSPQHVKHICKSYKDLLMSHL